VIANGDPLMGLVTALGCAGSALTALGVAGEVAAQDARGPGSFASAIIDALYSLDRATLRARTKVS
jgi:hydroxyethylthiazole kinase